MNAFSSSPLAATPSEEPAASPASTLADQLRLLRQAYAERLNDKVEHIIRCWQRIKASPVGAEQSEALILLHRLTHSLAGSGATFGFQAVSDHARRAEIVLKQVAYGGESLSPLFREEIETAYAQLQQAVSAPVEATGDLGLDDSTLAPPRTLYLFAPQTPELSKTSELPLWAATLQNFDYIVQSFTDTQELLQACQNALPAALIIDCDTEPLLMSWGEAPLSSVLHTISQLGDPPVPLLWTCRKSDLRTRLQAVRLGGAAFFTHPVDTDALLVKLDALTATLEPEPFRVLVVDDEPSLARLLCLILKQAGMETREVSDPFEIMAPLVDFRPDLILMDVYMPGCSGTELSRVIRQQEAYVGIPIVFLSVEADVSKQMDAMRQGGDDFLMKPVQPRHLVSAVTTRATRARVLRNLMIRDSLTGLLNHTKTTEQLAIELDRARRVGNTVSLAMIDIDSFKKVNDTYGHSTGDRVIRSLARMLVQRMRQTDVIGRYGGEEFAVIMSGADAANAQRVLESVRESFSKLDHHYDGNTFRVTFSVGIASAPTHASVTSISDAADKALYEAKRTGRNRIVLAP